MRGALVAAALLAGLLPAPGASQVPESFPGPGAPPDTAAQDTLAQDTTARRPVYVPPRWAISVEAGLLDLDPLQSQAVLAERIDGLGTVLGTATLTRTVAGKGGAQAAAAGLLTLDRAWAVRVAVGVGRVSIEPRYSGDQDLFVLSANRLSDTLDVAAWLLSASAGLRYRIPSARLVQPYVEAGVAFMRWSVDASAAFPDLEDAGRRSSYATVGAIVPLRGRLRAEIRATRRLFRTPVAPTAPQPVAPPSSTLLLTALAPATDAYETSDVAGELVSELRIDLGLSLGVGSLSGRSETPSPPSPPSR